MSLELTGVYQFNRFRLDATQRVLFEDDKIIPLPPKLFDTLLALVERNGRIIEKEELMNRVWPDSFVEENNLNKNISVLRKLLGEGKNGQMFIETVPKRGYRFVATVELASGDDDLIVATSTSTRVVIEEEVSSRDEKAQSVDVTMANTSAQRRLDMNPPAQRTGMPVFRLNRRVVLSIAAVCVLGVLIYLLRPLWTATSAPIKSIAVLPFKPLVAGGHDELFEMGMSETLINRLSSIREISVRPMSAVRKYTSLDQDPIAAGHEQRVDGVLEGNIQKTDDRIRVTVRLVSIKDGHTLWAEKFDARLTDIFDLQDSISERIASLMAVTLNGEEKTLLTRHHTNNPEAYQLYLKGSLFLSQESEESAKKALDCFSQAIALDPDYALAYVGRADVYAGFSSQYFLPAEAMPKAKTEVEKALALDAQLPEAHRSMARIKQWYDWDRPAAEKEFRRAIELQPNFAVAHISYGGFLTQEKRFDECLTEFKRAQELDPLAPYNHFHIGYLFYIQRDYDKAIEQYQEALALSPNYETALKGLGAAYREKGNYEQAIALLKKVVDLKRFDQYVSELGYTYAVAGRREEAKGLIRELEGLSKQRYVSPVRIARIYAGLGENEKVFECLNRAYAERSDHLLNLTIDPLFDGIRQDPRYKEMVRKIGLEL